MSSFLQLPWSSTGNNGGPNKQRQKQSSSSNHNSNKHDDSVTDMLAALGIDDSTADAELAALLAEAAAQGKVLTEDVVVDCQLTQFPAYGTNTTFGGNASDDDDEDGDDDDNNREASTNRKRNARARAAADAAASAAAAGEKNSSWFWMGAAGSATAAAAASPKTVLSDDDENYLPDNASSPLDPSNSNRNAAAAARSSEPAIDWDADEQRLWKTTTAATKSTRSRSNNADQPTQPRRSLRPDFHYYHAQQRPLRSTLRGKPYLLYRTPLVSPPVRAVATDMVASANHGGGGDADGDGPSNNDDRDSGGMMMTMMTMAPEEVVETTLAALSSPSGATTKTNAVNYPPRRTLQQKQQLQQSAMALSSSNATTATTTSLQQQQSQQQSSSSSTVLVTALADRNHWMPDQLCKQCYACETPFTVFRRRHHCRLCGQVFCSVCSANFVPTDTAVAFSGNANLTGSGIASSSSALGESNNYGSNAIVTPSKQTVRVCQMCYEHATSRQSAALALAAANAAGSSGSITKLGQETTPASDASSRLINNNTGEDVVPPPTSPASARRKEYPTSSKKSNSSNSNGKSDNTTVDSRARDRIAEGNRHMGGVAAEHLERLARELLRLRAPLLWKASYADNSDSLQNERMVRAWIHQLLTLATRCCATVTPNVKKGDLLDLRPYVKVKVIPGGSPRDCAYMSGVVFRKTVSHKRMAREVENPRIMLLSGGIEFTRTENRIASLETLFEQEEKYMEILVGKILKLKPDVLLVGRSVSRKAQELLLKAGVVLVRHVKSNLLNRISRQTGATVISSTDHIMNQFGESVLGKCRRFRLVTFRDNEAWTDAFEPVLDPVELNKSSTTTTTTTKENSAGDPLSGKKIDAAKTKTTTTTRKPKSIQALLADPTLSNYERQAALAANRLGEGVLDGSEAVKAGLAKRGVANTYIMLEGCPKELGCTVVLRGANRATLKQVKSVFRFLANAAYNLRLETTYLKERGARIRPDFKVLPANINSSSLCVDYGQPRDGRKVRPWNGGNSESSPRLDAGELSALDHQSILITSVWMTEKTQCCPAEVKGICYYSLQDVALGQFLRDSCFNLSLKCQNPNCKKSVLDHSLSFVHNDGLINIMVEEMDEPLPSSEQPTKNDDEDAASEDDDEGAVDRPIATWTYCQHCRKVVTPLTYISDNTWKFSFGKFLEVFFYNRDAILNAPGHGCSCNLQSNATLYFGCGKLAARFTYEKVAPFSVFVRKTLPLDAAFHRKEAMRRLGVISVESSRLFIDFDKHIEKITREARSLFNSAVNRPEHLQTVLSQLNIIGSEVDHAAKTLQEKIASISETYRDSDDASLNATLLQFPMFASRFLFNLTSAWNEKLSAAGQAITAMKKIAASSSHRNDGTLGPNASNSGDPLNEELAEGMKRLRQLIDHYARYNVTDITQVLPSVPGGNEIAQEVDYDEEFDDPETSIDFAEGVDADVLASRRRLSSKQSNVSERSRTPSGKRPTKTLGTRRSLTHESSSINAPPKPPPGGAGAVKSALTRFFNRGGRDYDRYVVNLGIFAEGRPRLPLGVDGAVIPVFDEQLSTIIAYSLASLEYSKQFKHFTKSEGLGPGMEGADTTERSRKSSSEKPDLDAGVGDESEIQASHPREKQNPPLHPGSQNSPPPGVGGLNDDVKGAERRMLNRNKSHIKHTFRDVDEKGTVICKFVCTTYWATQFHAVRQGFLCDKTGQPDRPENQEIEQSYIESLSSAYAWAASGGKSGASFARTSDDRFVIKCISRTELQMFLDCAPAYFEYLSKAFFHGLPTVLCKIVGVYQIGVHNRETGKRTMEQVAVMQNIFCDKKITRVFDLKGSLRGRFTARVESAKEEGQLDAPNSERWSENPLNRPTSGAPSSENNLIVDGESTDDSQQKQKESESGPSVLLDGDFLEFTSGRPMPLTDRAKAVFQMSILNDTLFLSIINVLDYSIVVGVDEETKELVVGIIDFMRQYDILKQMERVGKSLPMVVGSEAPTIIQPPLYKARFTNAMERYFMTVPSKWTTI